VVLNWSILLWTIAASIYLAPQATKPSDALSAQSVRTIQIAIDADCDALIENRAHQRLGFDPQTAKVVNEIPGARILDRENAAMFVLPYDPTGKLYTIRVTGRSTTDANVTMTGPGFVIGVRQLHLKSGKTETIAMSSAGEVSLTATEDGPTAQVFLTAQSGRSAPSYRFEVAAAFLSRGKTMTVALVMTGGGILRFNSDERKPVSFSVNMRRTNPSGSRDVYAHRNISFGKTNSYLMDFREWNGKGEMPFCELGPWDDQRCQGFKNEAVESKN